MKDSTAKLYHLKSNGIKWVLFPYLMECVHLTCGYRYGVFIRLKLTTFFFYILSYPFNSWLLIKLSSTHADNKFWVSQNCNNAKDDSQMSPKKTAFCFLSRGKELKRGHQLIPRACAFLWKTCHDMQLPRDWTESRTLRDTREDTFSLKTTQLLQLLY